jgi:hypothetical protein
MDPAKGIGRLGFRRWYERELYEAYAYLVTSLLCMILLAVALEQHSLFSLRPQGLLAFVLAFAAFAIGLHSLRRFFAILQRAQGFARAAACASCAAYGKLEVLESGTTAAESPGAERLTWLRVRCRKCGKAWRID